MKVFVAGHNGMVGSAVVRRFNKSSSISPLLSDRRVDYTKTKSAERVLHKYRPEAAVICAAKVGGIHANNAHRADFIYTNLAIQTNWIKAAHDYGLRKLILLSSSCVYPKGAKQPIRESQMLTGDFEDTNRAYATAKVAGAEMCKAYFHQHGCDYYALVPPNLFGQHDNYRYEESHAVASIIRKVYEARDGGVINIWGTGTPRRELMHVDDAAAAIEFSMREIGAHDVYPYGVLNAGTGEEWTIKAIADYLIEVSGKNLSINLNGKMDGMPRKVMDSSRIGELGWSGPAKGTRDRLREAYLWFDAAASKGLKGAGQLRV